MVDNSNFRNALNNLEVINNDALENNINTAVNTVSGLRFQGGLHWEIIKIIQRDFVSRVDSIILDEIKKLSAPRNVLMAVVTRRRIRAPQQQEETNE